LSAYGPEYVIQAYYKYRPASFKALALLVHADSKDRFAQIYHADMLRMISSALKPSFQPPRLFDLLNMKQKKEMTKEKASDFVDKLIHRFGKGGKK
jgi:hypothetical protein